MTILVCAAAQAQMLDRTASLKSYAAKIQPRCPDGIMTVEPVQGGPKNFNAYAVTIRSSDEYCGGQKYMLHSPKTDQILIGAVIALPGDARPVNTRVSEEASRLMSQKITATVAPFPLQDGLKAVSMMRDTAFGPFAYNGYVDASDGFLIVGSRGNLKVDPAQSIREALGVASAVVRKGNTAAKTEIIELSDFQCPTCARAHSKIDPLIKQNLSKVNYGRMDLPLFEAHNWAMQAAMAARAIQRVAPAKYWAYVDYVFKNQEEIGKRKIDDVVKEWMEDNDVDWTAVSKIYNSQTERQTLLDQVSRAFAVGIAATPTFVVNGQIMGFGPEGAFTIDAIKSAVGATATAAKKSGK